MSNQSNGLSPEPRNVPSARPAEASDDFKYQPDEIVDGDADPGGLPPFDPGSPARLEDGDVFHFQPNGVVDGDADPGELPPFDPSGPNDLAAQPAPDNLDHVADAANDHAADDGGGGDDGLGIIVWDFVG